MKSLHCLLSSHNPSFPVSCQFYRLLLTSVPGWTFLFCVISPSPFLLNFSANAFLDILVLFFFLHGQTIVDISSLTVNKFWTPCLTLPIRKTKFLDLMLNYRPLWWSPTLSLYLGQSRKPTLGVALIKNVDSCLTGRGQEILKPYLVTSRSNIE